MGFGKEEHGVREVLIEVRRPRVSGECLALRAIGKKQENFRVAAFDLRRKYCRNRSAVDRFPENNVAVCEVELCVLLRDLQIADAVARGGVETSGEDGPAKVGRSGLLGEEHRCKRGESCEAGEGHLWVIISIPGQV